MPRFRTRSGVIVSVDEKTAESLGVEWSSVDDEAAVAITEDETPEPEADETQEPKKAPARKTAPAAKK